jgi:hypothetical protein
MKDMRNGDRDYSFCPCYNLIPCVSSAETDMGCCTRGITFVKVSALGEREMPGWKPESTPNPTITEEKRKFIMPFVTEEPKEFPENGTENLSIKKSNWLNPNTEFQQQSQCWSNPLKIQNNFYLPFNLSQ